MVLRRGGEISGRQTDRHSGHAEGDPGRRGNRIPQKTRPEKSSLRRVCEFRVLECGKPESSVASRMGSGGRYPESSNANRECASSGFLHQNPAVVADFKRNPSARIIHHGWRGFHGSEHQNKSYGAKNRCVFADVLAGDQHYGSDNHERRERDFKSSRIGKNAIAPTSSHGDKITSSNTSAWPN